MTLTFPELQTESFNRRRFKQKKAESNKNKNL